MIAKQIIRGLLLIVALGSLAIWANREFKKSEAYAEAEIQAAPAESLPAVEGPQVVMTYFLIGTLPAGSDAGGILTSTAMSDTLTVNMVATGFDGMVIRVYLFGPARDVDWLEFGQFVAQHLCPALVQCWLHLLLPVYP